MGKSNLGPEFWGQWYRVDKTTYTEEALRQEVKTLGIQTTLVAGDNTITMEQLQSNMLQIKEHLRRKGFRPPCASDWRALCVWDLAGRACNSSYMYLQTYLVQSRHIRKNVRNILLFSGRGAHIFTCHFGPGSDTSLVYG